MDWPPGTEERNALAEVEARLRTLQARFNLYTAQHRFYGVGMVFALGFALFTFLAFSLSSFWFILAAWPLLALAGFVCVRFLRQGIADWTNLHTAASRIDLQVGLKQRLSTLTAQLLAKPANGPPASRLWAYLLHDNMDRLSVWETKKVAPRRIPWSALPFLATLVLAFLVASVPLLSPASEPEPFSLTNLELISAELPERTGQLVDKRLALPPADLTAQTLDPLPVGETLSEQADSQASLQEQAADEDGLGQELLDLASLPEDLQQALRTALQGLQESQASLDERDAAEGLLNDEQQLAQNGQSAQQAGDASQQARGEDQGGQDAERTAPGSHQAPEQGSGLQKLKQARLDRRKAVGAFPSANPQLPRRGGQAGRGGSGAGTSTDPRLYGNEASLGGRPQTFSLSLDASFEKSRTGHEIVKDEGGGVILKSTSQLSANQALDDAIRNAQIPPEYEDIVKHLFSRGAVQ